MGWIDTHGEAVVLERNSNSDRRQHARTRALKRVKLIFGNGHSAIDCLVIDQSSDGLRVETALPMSIPERVVVRSADGATLDAECRWVRGREIGLQFVKTATLSEEASVRAMAILETYKADGFQKAYEMLCESRFFGDPELQRGAEDARAILRRFEQLLGRHRIE